MCKVSVIIPNYNGKKYLKDCLDAMENQSFRDFEVLLVDNGSEDGSREYVEEVYPWVRLIPLEDFEPDGRYATVEEAMDAGAVESAHGLNVDALPQEYRDDPDQIGYELCDAFLDDFEQFGYVTALK